MVRWGYEKRNKEIGVFSNYWSKENKMTPFSKFDARIKLYAPRRKKIIRLMRKGLSLKEVADETGADKKTVWRNWKLYADEKEKTLRENSK